MADLSDSSDMMALEGLPEELLKKTLRPHCYRVMEQGVIMVKIYVINELRMYDLPKHSKSTAGAISDFLNFVDDQINRNKSVDPIPVIQKSVIEKPINNPCKNLPDVAGQDTIRASQAKIVEPKSPNKSTETKSSTSTLGGNKTMAKMLVKTENIITQRMWTSISIYSSCPVTNGNDSEKATMGSIIYK